VLENAVVAAGSSSELDELDDVGSSAPLPPRLTK
jgi:hypothetical protein